MISNFQKNKGLVLKLYQELDQAQGNHINQVLGKYTNKDYLFRGMHPFYELYGSDSAADEFWKPLRRALVPTQRRQDIFIAGINDVDKNTEWVCSMGHLMGLLDNDWLGIKANRKMAFLRYAEFNRIEKGLIVETALFCDIISLMKQAGLNPLPLQTGADFITPGPRTHDGLLFDKKDHKESQKTLDLVNKMCIDLTSSDMESPIDELKETWQDDMIWYGPSGIGATYTIDRYQEQHQGPFSDGLDNLKFHGHVCRIAEGNYAGWFGWPNLTMKTSGNFMGLPKTEKTVEMRVVDIYRREGNKLAENWIFIDLLYFLMQQGVDVLNRTEKIVNI
jgi:predicted ester cyclase